MPALDYFDDYTPKYQSPYPADPFGHHGKTREQFVALTTDIVKRFEHSGIRDEVVKALEGLRKKSNALSARVD